MSRASLPQGVWARVQTVGTDPEAPWPRTSLWPGTWVTRACAIGPKTACHQWALVLSWVWSLLFPLLSCYCLVTCCSVVCSFKCCFLRSPLYSCPLPSLCSIAFVHVFHWPSVHTIPCLEWDSLHNFTYTSKMFVELVPSLRCSHGTISSFPFCVAFVFVVCLDECHTWRTRSGQCCVFPLLWPGGSLDHSCSRVYGSPLRSYCELPDRKRDWCDGKPALSVNGHTVRLYSETSHYRFVGPLALLSILWRHFCYQQEYRHTVRDLLICSRVFLVPGLGSYMYIESRMGSKGNKARLISPALLGPQCMTFFYNMFGLTMGSLVIYIRETPGGNENIIWVQSGNKGLAWKEEHLSINEEDQYQVSWVQRCVLTSLPFLNTVM